MSIINQRSGSLRLENVSSRCDFPFLKSKRLHSGITLELMGPKSAQGKYKELILPMKATIPKRKARKFC